MNNSMQRFLIGQAILVVLAVTLLVFSIVNVGRDGWLWWEILLVVVVVPVSGTYLWLGTRNTYRIYKHWKERVYDHN